MNMNVSTPEVNSSLLREFIDVSQQPECFRRLFTSDNLRLWLWYLEDKTTLVGFQLLVGDSEHQKAFTWNTGGKLSCREVESDERNHGYAMTDVLGKDAGAIRPEQIRSFNECAKNLDQDLMSFIVKKMVN